MKKKKENWTQIDIFWDYLHVLLFNSPQSQPAFFHWPWKEYLISLHIGREEAKSELTPGKIFNPMFRILNKKKDIYKDIWGNRAFLYFWLENMALVICSLLTIQMYLALLSVHICASLVRQVSCPVNIQSSSYTLWFLYPEYHLLLILQEVTIVPSLSGRLSKLTLPVPSLAFNFMPSDRLYLFHVNALYFLANWHFKVRAHVIY